MKYQFRRFSFQNRWNKNKHFRGDWVILGVQKWAASPTDKSINFCLFGFELWCWFQINYK